MPDEATDRSQPLLAGLTSLVLLGGLGILAAAFLRDRRLAPEPAPRPPRAAAPSAPPSAFAAMGAPASPTPGTRPLAGASPAARPADMDDLVAGAPWDALGVALLKYSVGSKPQGGIPPAAAALLGEWQTRLDRIAKKRGLPDAQSALYLPEVRDRLAPALLGAAGVVLTPEQEALVRKFDQEEYGEAWRKEALQPAAPPLSRALRILESQERYERFLKSLLKPEQLGAYLGALGEDPLRNERIPCEAVKAAAQDRAQAVAERWDQAFNHAVAPDLLRGRAADLVWRMDDLRSSYETREGRPLCAESERAVRRKLLRMQVEAEAMVCPAPSAGSARALRFEAP